MSELLGMYPEPTVPVRDGLPTVPMDNQERAALSFEAAQYNDRSYASERALAAEFDRVAPAFRAAGVELANPFDIVDPIVRPAARILPALAPLQNAADQERERRMAAWDEAATRLQADPETASLYPTMAGLREQARQRAQALQREANAADGMGGGFGGFLGQAAAVFTDPLQIVTLPLGAPYRGGALLAQIGRTALIEAGIGATSQAVVEATNLAWRREAGLANQAAENILVAGAAAGVLGGGLRGLLGLLELRVPRGTEATTPAQLAAQDAAQQIDARLLADAGRPGGPETQRAHEAALDAAVDAVTGGRLPAGAVPPAAAPPDVDVWTGLDLAGRRQRTADIINEVIGSGGSNPSAAWRPDIGVITIDWGLPGNANRQGRGGYGLAHIIARRDSEGLDGAAFVRDRLPDILTNGRVVDVQGPPNGLRLVLRDGQDDAVLSLFRNGDRESWVVTAYPPKKGGPGEVGGGNPAPPYAPASSGLQTTAGAGPSTDIAPALRRFNAYTPPGRSVLVEPRVVELDTLIPSHLDDGGLNPAFPHTEGVQPRDRAAAPSQDQIRAIAAGLIPERLEPNREAGLGAPIIGHDLVVESGNARTLALRQVYVRPDLAQVAEGYRAHLAALGYDTTGMKHPVLVSARITALAPNERRAFVAEANGRTTLDATTAETARADAGRMDSALPLYQGGDIDSAANAPFIRQFLSGMTAEDRGAMLVKGGSLSAAGLTRIRNAILARAYGDELGPLLERFLETQNEGLRGIAGALTDAAPAWSGMRRAALRGEIDPAMDTTADLIDAVRLIDDARRRGLTVPDLIAQADLDRPMPTQAAIMWINGMRNPETGAQKARPTIAGILRGYADEAMTTRAGGDLFGDAAPAPAARIDAVAGRRADVPDTPPMTGTSDGAAPRAADAPPTDGPAPRGLTDPAPDDAGPPLFLFDDPPVRVPPPAPAPPTDPVKIVTDTIAENSRAAETARAAPAAPDAAVLEAQRIAARQDIAVPLEVESEIGTPGVGTIGARQLLDEAEDGVRQAAEASACLIGGLA